MARCAAETCNRWRPALLARRVAGVTIDGRWFCSQTCVERMARRLLLDGRPSAPGAMPPVAPLRLGVLLRHHGAITPLQLEVALEAQRETGLLLGAQLRALGFTEDEAIVRALAEQCGVRYLRACDYGCVRDAPGGLPLDAVRALGLIPLSRPDGAARIKVACVAPVPRTALTALRRLTGWTGEPYLVADADWDTLLAVYAAGTTARTPPPMAAFIKATSLSDAATRIARAAAVSRHTTVTEAHWDPYTWVRVEAAGVIHDVLLSHADEEEAPCPAATTSH